MTGNSYSYVVGPLIAFAGLGILVLMLRWTFKRGGSLIAAPAQQGQPQEYGMLVPIASPGSYIQGEMWRRSLEDEGIKATLTQTLDGPRIMVWPQDEQRARGLVQRMP
ncbi:MAG: hypothetical protein ACYYNF_04430 [Actinomycetes bacterium]|nr:hypothetical protein [Candidatus Nanopelagicales bacterium]MDP4825632.1 hypothetical protein [Candidatus Nanopelagicales bacterium]MDP4887992.1 hypothetical protein [Candidatus Nanopelagicales bacterium]